MKRLHMQVLILAICLAAVLLAKRYVNNFLERVASNDATVGHEVRAR